MANLFAYSEEFFWRRCPWAKQGPGVSAEFPEDSQRSQNLLGGSRLSPCAFSPPEGQNLILDGRCRQLQLTRIGDVAEFLSQYDEVLYACCPISTLEISLC
jgi:hypothetical protein